MATCSVAKWSRKSPGTTQHHPPRWAPGHHPLWPPPIGIEYVVDSANAFLLVLVSGISTVVLLYARDQIKFEIEEESHTLFYTCYLLCLTGLLGVLITGDVFNVFVFLEILI